MNNQTELEQILRNFKNDGGVSPDASFRTNARIRILNTVSGQARSVPGVNTRSFFTSFAFRIAAILLFLSGGTIVYAAQSSNPSDALYSIKVASERTAMTLSPSGSLKTEVAATIISHRADEIVHAQKEGNKKALQQSVTSYKETVGKMLGSHSVSRDAIQREIKKHDRLIKKIETEDNEDAGGASGINTEPTVRTDEYQTENSEKSTLTPVPTVTSEANVRGSSTENQGSRESDD